MFELNGRYYCKYCFEQLSGQEHSCTEAPNSQKYPGSLSEGMVLDGKYIVGKVIGKGGFGITYLCFDIESGIRVAIKEYFPATISLRKSGETTVHIAKEDARAMYDKGAKRFFEEAKMISGLKNAPGIVDVKKFFKENGTVYFVMEYLSGMDLKCYLGKNLLNENQIMHITTEVLKSLRILHSKNILHRDISPDNIFVCDDGTIKLIDFGASRVAAQNEIKTLSVILKPGFAPIEQYQSKGKQGPWTDIYALGATVYYMFTLLTPPEAAARYDNSVLRMEDVPDKYHKLIYTMMSISVDYRYRSADEVLGAIGEITGQGSGSVSSNSQYSPSVADDSSNSQYNPLPVPKKDMGMLLWILLSVLGVSLMVLVIAIIIWLG